MKHRATIEGTVSEAVRGYGLRRNRYRGVDKIQLQAYLATAINLKRLMATFPVLFLFWVGRQFDAFFNTIIFHVRQPKISTNRNIQTGS